MAKLAIKKASTDVTTYVFIQDSSKTTGEGLAGLAYNTGSLVGYYVRPKGSATAITLATQTVTGDHSDGGFVEIDATNMPGVYRLDLPDAVCATGVPSVVVMLKGATNMSPVVLEIQLTDFDLNTAAITAAGIADAVWDEAISGHTTGTTFGGKNQKVVPSETINDYKADVSALTNVTLAAAYDKAKDDVLTPLAVVDSIVDGLKTTLDNIHDTDLPAVKTETAAIKAKTDLIPATPASAGEYTAAIAAIPTAPLLAANYTAPDNASIATIKAKTNLIPANPAVADEYDAALAAIQSDLDNPNQYKADVSGLATQASVNAIPTAPLLAANYVAPDNASIAAILEDTGTTIPATLAGLATSAEVGAITMLDEVVVGSYTMQDILKILAAKMVGKATGGSTATITYRGLDDTSDVIIETVDSNGNRSAVTLTV